MSFSPTATTDEWAHVARTRQGLYRFYGGALLPPDADRLDGLAAAAGYLDGTGLEAYAFYPRWRRVADRLREPMDLGPLNAEYVRLFATGLDGALCPPVESHYRARAEGGGTGTLIAALQREYRRLGLVAVSAAETSDHVSTELEVLSALCGREHAAWQGGDRAAAFTVLAETARFLRQHLLAWLPRFRRRVRTAGAEGFYPDVVEAACAFAVHDADLATVLLAEQPA